MPKKPTRKEKEKSNWLAKVDTLTIAEAKKQNGRGNTHGDYWPTLKHFYYKGMTPKEAAEKLNNSVDA